MAKLRKKIEAWMSAVAFAEAGEHEEALKLAGIEKAKKKWSFNDLMTAITFAEAGEPDIARQYLGVEARKDEAASLDIPGLRVWCGTVELEPAVIPGVKVWSGTASV